MTLSVNGAATALPTLQAPQTSTASAPASQTTSSSGTTSASTGAALTTHISPPSALALAADGLGQAQSAIDAGVAAGQSVLGLLHQMRAAASVAADPATQTAARTSLDQGFQSSLASLGDTLSGAAVNGTNLVDGSMRAALSVPLGDGVSTSVAAQDLSAHGATLSLAVDASLTTPAAAADSFASLGDAIGAAGQVVSSLQAQGDQLALHGAAIQALSQAGTSTGGADLDADGARLLALQVGQQLSGSSGTIAGSSSSILSLFRS